MQFLYQSCIEPKELHQIQISFQIVRFHQLKVIQQNIRQFLRMLPKGTGLMILYISQRIYHLICYDSIRVKSFFFHFSPPFLQRCNDTTNQARQSNAGTADTNAAHTNAEKAKEA